MDRVTVFLLLTIALSMVSGNSPYRRRLEKEIERELDRYFQQRSKNSSECGHKPADIVFVLDESGSIWGPHFQTQLQFVSDIVKSFDVEFNMTHFGVMTFADDSIIHFQLTEYHSFGELNAAIHRIDQRRGNTYTHFALDQMTQEMFDPAFSRSWVPHIGIVITDGASHYPELTAQAAEDARAEGITLFAIGVGTSVSEEELIAIGNSPADDYVFNVSSYNALEGIRDILQIKTCQVTTPEPTTTTALPTTTFIPTTTLPPPQSIERCTARGPIDVLFGLPDQAGVGDTENLLDFVASVAEQLEMGEEQALVGLTPRGCDDIADEIRLGDNDMLEGFRNALNGRRLASTETWRHLRYMHSTGILPASGGREDAQRFGVLVIDNKSTDKAQAIRQAGRAKAAGIHLLTIMIGEYADEDEVQQIASSSEDWFSATDYNELAGLVDGLIDRFCYTILHGGYGF